MNGAVVWSAQYAAFGEAHVGIETVTNNLRFPGQYYDAETGLHYNFQRYYHPGIGRYLRVDPIELGSGDVNWYAYSVNNPATHIDAIGLSPSDTDDCSACGPDVTDLLQTTLDDIDIQFKTWASAPDGFYLIKELCTIPFTFSSGKAGNAWDITNLKSIGGGSLPSEVWGRLGITQDGYGGELRPGRDKNVLEPECQFTVTFHKQCYNAGYLNFIMYGAMTRKCEDYLNESEDFKNLLSPYRSRANTNPIAQSWLSHSMFLASIWKRIWHRNSEGADMVENIVRLGYWNPFGKKGLAPHDTLERCKVDPDRQVLPAHPPLRWRWQPGRG